MSDILLIDDSRDFRDAVKDILFSANHTVWEAECVEDAFSILLQDHFDLIICDLELPFSKAEKFFQYQYSMEVGVRTIEELRNVYPFTPIVAVTGYHPLDILSYKERFRDVILLHKPISPRELLLIVDGTSEEASTAVIQ